MAISNRYLPAVLCGFGTFRPDTSGLGHLTFRLLESTIGMAKTRLISILVLAQVVLLGSAFAVPNYSKRAASANSWTGYVQANPGGSWYRGSGAVVRHPQLVYSCAHLLYENGRWATNIRFHRAHHSSVSPFTSGGVGARGYRRFASYSSQGSETNAAYNLDFIVLYSNTSYNTSALGWYNDGSAALRSTSWKRILGYPSDVDYTGVNGYAYQHATDWSSDRASRTYGTFHRLNDTSTGGGNSGGPVVVWDASQSKYYAAGVLVSGSSTTAGVRAFDNNSHTMASNALGVLGIGSGNNPAPSPTTVSTRIYRNSDQVLLQDAAPRFTAFEVNTSGHSGNTQELRFWCNISTPWRGDIEAYLVSPAGRVRWIVDNEGGSADHVIVTNQNFSYAFRNDSANGRWRLFLRDTAVGDRARYRDFAIKVKG